MTASTKKQLDGHWSMRDEVHAKANKNIIRKLTQDIELEEKVFASVFFLGAIFVAIIIFSKSLISGPGSFGLSTVFHDRDD